MGLSIDRKMQFGFGLGLVLVAAVGLVAYLNTREFIQANRWVTHTDEVLGKLEAINSGLAESQSAYRGYAITGEASFLETFRLAALQALEGIERARALTADNPRQQTRIPRLKASVDKKLKHIQMLLALPPTQEREAAKQFIDSAQGQVLTEKIRNQVTEMQDEEKNLLEIRSAKLASDTRRTLLTLAGIILLILALLTLVFYLVKHDSAQRRRNEEGLLQQTRLLEAVLGTMAEGIAVADLHGKCLVFNQAAETILGAGAATPDEDWSEKYGVFMADGCTVYPPGELPLTRAIRGESVEGIELYIRNPVAPLGKWISVTGRPLRSDREGLWGGVATFGDITDRKRAEDALRSFADKLQATNHDLEEALTKVKTLSGLLPICASCKRIRDQGGTWNPLESYVSSHSEAVFSHGICPACMTKLYPDYSQENLPV